MSTTKRIRVLGLGTHTGWKLIVAPALLIRMKKKIRSSLLTQFSYRLSYNAAPTPTKQEETDHLKALPPRSTKTTYFQIGGPGALATPDLDAVGLPGTLAQPKLGPRLTRGTNSR